MQLHRPASLDAYRRDLSDIVPLSADEEQALAAAWRAGDQRAGARLVSCSLPFVIRIAKEYRRWGIPMEDLIQQGNLGLLRAALKYDPAAGCRLVTYAVYWIRAEIRDYVVRGYRIVRLGTTRSERKALRAYRRDGAESVEELAASSGMPLARAQQLWPLLSQRDVALDASWDDRGPAADRLSAPAASPEEELACCEERYCVRKLLDAAMGELSERERWIVEERMLADEPRTLESLGRELGVSKERVRQLEARARTKLRGALAAYEPAAA